MFDNIHRLYASPGKKQLVEQTSHLRFTVSFRTNDLSDNIKETLKERLKSCADYSQALDESIDISDTALLVIFIRTATVGFDVVEEFLHMTKHSSTTTGQDICEHVIRVVEKSELNPAELHGLTTGGVRSMTGRTNGFSKKFMDAVGAQDVVEIFTKRTCVQKFWHFQKL